MQLPMAYNGRRKLGYSEQAAIVVKSRHRMGVLVCIDARGDHTLLIRYRHFSNPRWKVKRHRWKCGQDSDGCGVYGLLLGHEIRR